MSHDAGKIQKLLKEKVNVKVAGVGSWLRIKVYFLFIHDFTTRVAKRLPRTVSSWHAIRDEPLQGGSDRGFFPPSSASLTAAGQWERLEKRHRRGCLDLFLKRLCQINTKILEFPKRNQLPPVFVEIKGFVRADQLIAGFWWDFLNFFLM